MKVAQFKIKFLGKMAVMFRVLDASGSVVRVFDTKEEAEAFVAHAI